MTEAREHPIVIPGERGMLRGIRHDPVGADRGWSVLILQGYFSSTHVGPARMYVQLARCLARQGCEVVRLDCHGTGDSDGEFGETTFPSQLADYRRMVEHLRVEAPGRRQALLGHSLGGNLALRIAATDSQIRRVLLVSPGLGPFAPLSFFSDSQAEELRGFGKTGRKGLVVPASFIGKMQDLEVFGLVRGLDSEVIAFRGSADEYYPPSSLEPLLAALPATRLVEIPGGDHNFLLPGMRAAFLARFEQEMNGSW